MAQVSSRRLLSAGTELNVEVKAKSRKAAKKIAAELTQAKINEKLQEAGLPAVQITEAPHIYDTPPNGFGVAASRHAPASVWPHHDRFYWKEHQAKRHPTRLEKLGINVNSLGGSRAVPLPIFDETQWDHVHHLPRDNEFESAGRRNYRDVGLHIMKKAGVNVDAMPVENSDDDGWLPKDGVPNKEFVHTLFGLNTKTPYFSDYNEPNKENKKLLRAGVNVGSV